ncbi:phage tail fiber protein [Yersinia enterocolitica]|uniref:phage tail fiber protein n=1 Tax=Yersinia enterocolitica TaxID=630 RepID=UPI003F914445
MSNILKIKSPPTSPLFAQNNIKDYEDGQPIDIPVGRFVDLRVQMPEVEREGNRLEDKTGLNGPVNSIVQPAACLGGLDKHSYS